MVFIAIQILVFRNRANVFTSTSYATATDNNNYYDYCSFAGMCGGIAYVVKVSLAASSGHFIALLAEKPYI